MISKSAKILFKSKILILSHNIKNLEIKFAAGANMS